MASHFSVSLLPSSTIIGFLICFNFGAAAKMEQKEEEKTPSVLMQNNKKTKENMFFVYASGYNRRQGKRGETGAEPVTPLNRVSQRLSQVTSRCGHKRHHQLRLGLINMLIFTLGLLIQKHLRQYLANIHQLRRKMCNHKNHAQLKSIWKQEEL